MQAQNFNKRSKLYCPEHSNREVEFYCAVDGDLLCQSCTWEHSDHSKSIKVINYQMLLDYQNVLKFYLSNMKDELERRLVSVKNLHQLFEGSSQSQVPLHLFAEARQLLLNPFSFSEEDQKRIKTVFQPQQAFIEGSELIKD